MPELHPLCRIDALAIDPEPIDMEGRWLRPERSITRNSPHVLLHHYIASGHPTPLDKATLAALRKTSDALHRLFSRCLWQLDGFQVLWWPTAEHICFTTTGPAVFYRYVRNHRLLKKSEILDFLQLGDVAWLELRRMPVP
jgi:hypothetical protein